jgi:hypothetical protein
MLEHVALGQSRFLTPGVAPDPRGILLGRYGLLVFATLEGVVSWFRLYSAESSLDELLAGLEIYPVRTPLRSRAMTIRIPASSSYAMDRAARCAHLVGGSTFTGTSKHFVKYRDERSPYGYDATDVQTLPAGVDLMCHGENFVQSYTRENELAFTKLLYRLSLRRIPGADKLRPEQRQELLIVAAYGLGEGVIRYLWRNRIEAEVALARPRGESAFEERGKKAYLAVRARELPARILELFLATPGLALFRMVTANVAVQVGYAHVIELASCTSVFASEKFYVFWGSEDRVDVIDGPLATSSIQHLTRVNLQLDTPVAAVELESVQADAVGVELHLAPSLAPPRHVVGTLVPSERADWIKRLVYLLPQSSLRGHRVAVTGRGILLIATDDVDVIPLGQLLVELAPGLLVPLGMDLVPRVAPEVLSRTLGHGTGTYTIFPTDGPPFQVNEKDMVPLERRAVAGVEVSSAPVVNTRVESPGTATVVNDPVGRFALWGFPPPPERDSSSKP